MTSKPYVYIYHDEDVPIYVGMGVGARYKIHLKRRDKHPFVQRLQKMKACGKDPWIEIIEIETREEASMLEMFYIQALGRKDLNQGTLLNLSDGGEGNTGYRFTDAQRKVQSVNSKSIWSRPSHRVLVSKRLKAIQTKELNVRRGKAVSKVLNTAENKAKRTAIQKAVQGTEESRSRKRKACTIDGITIFKSKKDLMAALGQGLTGSRHPNFRFV